MQYWKILRLVLIVNISEFDLNSNSIIEQKYVKRFPVYCQDFTDALSKILLSTIKLSSAVLS